MIQALPRDVFPRAIVTQRLRLRSPEPRERDLYARQFADAYVTAPKPISAEYSVRFADFMLEHWRRYGFGFFALDVLNGSKPPATIGHAGFKYVDAWPGHWAETYDAIELGYSILPSERGKGYVTEACRSLLDVAFATFRVATIRARCIRENVKSAAVLQRCGMAEVEPDERYRNFEISRTG